MIQVTIFKEYMIMDIAGIVYILVKPGDIEYIISYLFYITRYGLPIFIEKIFDNPRVITKAEYDKLNNSNYAYNFSCDAKDSIEYSRGIQYLKENNLLW